MLEKAAIGLFALSQALQGESPDTNPFKVSSECIDSVPAIRVNIKSGATFFNPRTLETRDPRTGTIYTVEITTNYFEGLSVGGLMSDNSDVPPIHSGQSYPIRLIDNNGKIEKQTTVTPTCTLPVSSPVPKI